MDDAFTYWLIFVALVLAFILAYLAALVRFGRECENCPWREANERATDYIMGLDVATGHSELYKVAPDPIPPVLAPGHGWKYDHEAGMRSRIAQREIEAKHPRRGPDFPCSVVTVEPPDGRPMVGEPLNCAGCGEPIKYGDLAWAEGGESYHSPECQPPHPQACDDCGCIEPVEEYDSLEGRCKLCHTCAEAGGLLDGDPYTDPEGDPLPEWKFEPGEGYDQYRCNQCGVSQLRKTSCCPNCGLELGG